MSAPTFMDTTLKFVDLRADLAGESDIVLEHVTIAVVGADGFFSSEDVNIHKSRATPERSIRNMLAARKRGWQSYKIGEFRGQVGVICGGAPSMAKLDQIREIRRLQKRGAQIYAMNRTHDWLLTKGIVPDAACLLDIIPHVSGYIKPRRGVRYYVGSQCDPLTFDNFERPGIEKYIYHAIGYDEQLQYLTPQEIDLSIPKMGTTVSLRTLCMMVKQGFTEIHMFGVDSCYENEDSTQLHAYHKPEALLDKKRAKIEFPDGPRTYWSSMAMLSQAECFEQMMRHMNQGQVNGLIPIFKVYVHGDGLIPDIASHYGIHACKERNFQHGKN